jgi:CHASE2 domain-containing sensor protein
MSCPNLLKNEIKHCLVHFFKGAGRQLWAKHFTHWLIAISLIGLGTFLGHKLGESQIWMDLRYKAYQSVLYRLTPRAPHPKRTVLVLINDQEYWSSPLDGRRPIKRDYLAKLVRKLADANPAVIALDVDLSLATDRSVYESGPYKSETEELLGAVKEVCANRTVVLARRLAYADASETEFQPVAAVFDGYPFGDSKVRSGYITLPPDIRRIPLALMMHDRTTRVDSFASAILGAIDEQSLRDAKEKEQDALPYGTFIEPQRFIQRSADYVFSSDAKTLQNDMAFKVVIVGGAWHQFGVNQGPEYDSHASPVGDVYGAFVHANYVEALLDSRTYKPMRQSLATGIEVFFSMVLAVFLSFDTGLAAKLGMSVFLCMAILGISYVAWQNLGLFFDFLVPVVLLGGHIVVEKVVETSE